MHRPRPQIRAAFLQAIVILAVSPAASAQDEPIDLEVISLIRDEGLRHSKVMETLSHLTDVIGPRLTGSPSMKLANEWTAKQMADWGLVNAKLEAWGPFGRGWSFSHASVHMLTPRAAPLFALPKAWTPGTAGPVRGKARRLSLESKEDLEQHKGQLQGAILLLDDAAEMNVDSNDLFQRHSDDELDELTSFPIPGSRGGRGGRADWRSRNAGRRELRKSLNQYLIDEGVVATVSVSSRSNGILLVSGGGSREPDESAGVPSVVMAAEHYNLLLRLLEGEAEVDLEIDVAAGFHDDDPMAYNTVAEIPGSDLADEVVMLGGHLDSWHAGTGATDNGAGCAVMMEAARILKALDLKPRRTIRVALWSGEEQGLLGSRAYVKDHFAYREEVEGEDSTENRRSRPGELILRPEHAGLAAYFNLDNGSGKIRGVYAEENAAVKPIFGAWLEPFVDLGADTVTMRKTGGTDHGSFQSVGLAGFQYIQDGLDYNSRTHHTHLDTYDHAQSEDLMQASVIVASFAYHAAMRDDQLPRPPLPRSERSGPNR